MIWGDVWDDIGPYLSVYDMMDVVVEGRVEAIVRQYREFDELRSYGDDGGLCGCVAIIIGQMMLTW